MGTLKVNEFKPYLYNIQICMYAFKEKIKLTHQGVHFEMKKIYIAL